MTAQKRSLRSHVATAAGRTAKAASKLLGRGAGGMIGGQVALTLDPSVMRELARGRRCVTVTGTNGKSTTNRMVRAALSTQAHVASNVNGDNMPPGIVTALMNDVDAPFAALEVDEMHLPIVADAVDPAAMILLNLSRDQLDRVGEIGSVEKRLREAVESHPDAVVVANCDDPLIASAAWDSPNVVWVAAGMGWGVDSVSFPRGGRVVRGGPVGNDEGRDWKVVPIDAESDQTVTRFRRPDATWWLEDIHDGVSGESGASATIVRAGGERIPLELALPGRANLGNALQAIVAAHALGIAPVVAAQAVARVAEVAGRYARYDIDGRSVRTMLAKNPAGWQEAMGMIDPDVDQVVVAVNGQVADGQDLSWLWDVSFEALREQAHARIIACGERGSDLVVRMEYAGFEPEYARTPIEAIRMCDPGPVELLANYTALRDLKKVLEKETSKASAADTAADTAKGAGNE